MARPNVNLSKPTANKPASHDRLLTLHSRLSRCFLRDVLGRLACLRWSASDVNLLPNQRWIGVVVARSSVPLCHLHFDDRIAIGHALLASIRSQKDGQKFPSLGSRSL